MIFHKEVQLPKRTSIPVEGHARSMLECAPHPKFIICVSAKGCSLPKNESSRVYKSQFSELHCRKTPTDLRNLLIRSSVLSPFVIHSVNIVRVSLFLFAEVSWAMFKLCKISLQGHFTETDTRKT